MNNKKLEDLLADKSFVLWIKGACPPKEKQYWDAWLGEKPENKIMVREGKEIVFAFHREYKTPNPKAELKKLNETVDRYEDRLSRVRYKNHKNYNRFYRKSRGPIAAGILLLMVLLGSIFAYQNYPVETEKTEVATVAPVQEYNTGYGEKLTFRLSDGSRIVLNANSRLKFSSKIKKRLNTEVWLEGEAWFNIAHLEGDRQRTFTVHTTDGSIQVLGTRFAVNTFASQTQTVLEEGKISIRVKEDSPDASTAYLLKPGEMARFVARDNKIAVKKVNTLIYTSWTKDKLIFEHTPMEEVARRIQDTFGIEVVVARKLSDETLTGSIKSDNLEVLTKALSEILKTTIKKQDQKLFIGRTENQN